LFGFFRAIKQLFLFAVVISGEGTHASTNPTLTPSSTSLFCLHHLPKFWLCARINVE
jgi:hypothetical protein